MLRAREVVGIDPNRRSINAAAVRAQGYDLGSCAVRFEAVDAGRSLPFPDGRFDLITCVSVMEFVSAPSGRATFARELQRVTKPGGHIFIATPSPWRLREYHSRLWLGHLRRRDGYPWSSSPKAIRRMFADCERRPIAAFVLNDFLERRRLPSLPLARIFAPALVAAMPRQKHLFRKRS